MKKRILIALVVVLALAVTASVVWAGTPDGASGPWADSCVENGQGKTKAGSTIPPARSDPEDALGPADGTTLGTFFSLGFPNGYIVLGFDNYICNGDGADIEVIEVTWGTYPLEQAQVLVSQDGVGSWQLAGTVNNAGTTMVDLPAELPWVRYVKIRDVTDPNLHASDADGYDLDAVKALHTSETPCLIIVDIDIKPGSYPNCFNMNGNGVVPVAILGSADLDVTQINVSTLKFGGLDVRVKGNGTPQCSVEDVSGDFTYPEGAPDGFDDLVCQFVDNPDTWTPDDGTATLSGNLKTDYGGTPFEGSDEICLRPE